MEKQLLKKHLSSVDIEILIGFINLLDIFPSGGIMGGSGDYATYIVEHLSADDTRFWVRLFGLNTNPKSDN